MVRLGMALAAIGIAGLLAGCGGDGTGPGGSTGLQLRGRIASVAGARVAAAPASGAAGAAVAKVLVYQDFGVADVVPVDANGSFAVDVARKACGLVFLDETDHVVGYLALASGITALPLMMVDSAVAAIDLADITIADSVATPSHDPVGAGGEAQMSAEEIAAYRLQSSLFASIVRNLDMNHDGVIDVLSSRPYWISFGADFDGGLAPTSDPGAGAAMPVLNVFHFGFSDYHLNAGTPPAMLYAPDGSSFRIHETNPYTVIRDGQPQGTATMYHWVLQNTSWDAFRAGTYTIAYDAGGPVSFDVTDPLNVSNYVVAANFWYERTGARITRVHWKWKMLDGRPIDATRLLRRDVVLGFGYGVARQVTYADLTSADTVRAVDVDTTGLTSVLLWGVDLFGNNLPTNYRFH